MAAWRGRNSLGDLPGAEPLNLNVRWNMRT